MDTSHLSTNERRAFWRGHIEQWRRSEQSQAAYCRKHNLTPHRFRYWKQYLTPPAPTAEPSPVPTNPLLPIQVMPNPERPSGADNGITIRLPTGIGIELSSRFDPETLRSVVRTLSD